MKFEGYRAKQEYEPAPLDAELFKIGKFDPTNPRHIDVLVELGVLDEDLKDLAGQ